MKCENLDVWKRSRDPCIEIYRYFKELKDYHFKDQITRSNLSIPSNTAEGMEKNSHKEKIKFIEISKGSAVELITQIFIGIEINYINKKTGLN